MATSVQNRQYIEIPRPYKPGPTAHHRPNSPLRKPTTNFTAAVTNYSSDSDDEDDFIENQEYLAAIKKATADLEPPVRDPRDEHTADHWVERNQALVRLTGKHPFNAEPPLAQLMRHGFITPVPLHYVRNHGAVPKAAAYEEWTVEVTGLVKRPMIFTMRQLETEFPSREFPATLVCAGNRRKEQNMVKKTIGFNWGNAAISTSLWKGVPLHLILKRCGIMTKSKGALNVCFEGAEDLPGGGGSKYGTGLKKEIAMDPSRDIILAYMQNGERLTPDHGFPVRMIIPGFIGGRMVKWLKKIVVTTQESDSYYHWRDNKVLPSHVDAELANSEAWWYKPDYAINELNVNSIITTPSHEEILPINSWTTQMPYTLRGYAYSGGGKKVTRVEVTMDGGETWSACELDHRERPNKYGKYWCWCFWSLQVEVLDLLAAKEVAVRAWDESHNTQPERLIWNLMGMMNNCWFKIRINVCKPGGRKGEIGLVFDHPAQPGSQSGGWMAKDRHLEISNPGPQTLKKSVSSPFMNTNSKTFTLDEVRARGSRPESAWIVVHGHVYDCTAFLKDHPGGADSILINAGTDCTEEFDAIHSDKAKKILEEYRIGELVVAGPAEDPPPAGPTPPMMKESAATASVALIPRERIHCRLVSKTSLSRDVRLFRFALPRADQVLGLPVGKHIFLCGNIDGKLCMRAYTPSSPVDMVGYFELVVKIYFKNVHPKFPNGGLMTQYLDGLEVGSTVDVKGPLGHIEYTGRGNFMVHGKPKFARKLAMVAGGSGITPIYQVMQAVLKDPEDKMEMWLVYANRTEDDILLRDELDGWAREYPDRVRVWYVVSESVREGWGYDVGLITEEVLKKHMPAAGGDVLALACGPPPMLQFAVNPNLEKLGYDLKEDLLVF